jgi:hypothetical protein
MLALRSSSKAVHRPDAPGKRDRHPARCDSQAFQRPGSQPPFFLNCEPSDSAMSNATRSPPGWSSGPSPGRACNRIWRQRQNARLLLSGGCSIRRLWRKACFGRAAFPEHIEVRANASQDAIALCRRAVGEELGSFVDFGASVMRSIESFGLRQVWVRLAPAGSEPVWSSRVIAGLLSSTRWTTNPFRQPGSSESRVGSRKREGRKEKKGHRDVRSGEPCD